MPGEPVAERDPDMNCRLHAVRPGRCDHTLANPGWAYEVDNRGAPQDFQRIVEENHQRVYNVIFRMIEDREEAEDLTQDTFVNAFRAWDSFRHESQIYTWLYRIAVNLTKNRLDRRGRRRATDGPSLDAPVEVDEDDVMRQIEDWRMAPDRAAENTELERVLAQHVTCLRPEYKEVIILRDYEDLSYEDIAKVLGCSIQAVKSRLFRARSVLRRVLTDYLEGGP